MIRMDLGDPAPFVTMPSLVISLLVEPVPLTVQVTVTPV